MEVERANAFTMYYEPFELEGKRLYGTGYAVDHDTVRMVFTATMYGLMKQEKVRSAYSSASIL